MNFSPKKQKNYYNGEQNMITKNQQTGAGRQIFFNASNKNQHHQSPTREYKFDQANEIDSQQAQGLKKIPFKSNNIENNKNTSDQKAYANIQQKRLIQYEQNKNNHKKQDYLPAISAGSDPQRPKAPFQQFEANKNIELTNYNQNFSKVQASEQHINSQKSDKTDEIGIITTTNENGINTFKKNISVQKSNKYNQYQIEEAKQSQKQGRRITGQQQPNSSKIIAINQKPKFKFIVLTCAIENNIYRSDVFYYTNHSESGKLYRTEYDLLNYNPTYMITEGYYNMDDPHSIKIIDKRVEYLGKSNNIKPVQQKEQIQKNTQYEPNVSKKIKIFDQEGTLLNNGSQKRFVQIQTWIKFNQQISQRDITILKPSSRDWLTSSIIDSYALYLNLENQKMYFSFPESSRKMIKRLFIVDSSIFTSFFFKNRFEYKEQHLDILKKEFLEFQDIQFQVWEIYQQLAFIINQNNNHWFLILIDFQTQQMSFYDSSSSYSSEHYTQYFSNLFAKLGFSGKFQSSIIRNSNFTQSDGYSCGHRTCSFMKYLSDKQFNENQIYLYDEREIKRKLTQLLSE